MFVIKEFFYYLFAFFSILILTNCASIEKQTYENEEIRSYDESEDYHTLKKVKYSGPSSIKIFALRIDTMIFFHEAEGIKVTFTISVLPNVLDSLKKLNYTGLYINMECKTDRGVQYLSKNDLLKNQRFHINRDQFIATAGERNIEFQFPYRGLEMNQGIHTLDIAIQALPVKFKKDTTTQDFYVIENILPTAVAAASTSITVNAPQLFKTSVEVFSFKINTKVVDPQKFDFSVGGSGLPDLYWNMYCGESFIFQSPEERNAIQYHRKFKTKAFYCSKDDIIKINIGDMDSGPFNTEDDIVETWSGKINQLNRGHTDTISFGRLEYLVIKTAVE